MKISTDAKIGIAVVVAALICIAIYTGLYGILYIGIAFIFAIISIALFSKESKATKVAAVIINTDLLYKILMPSRYKKELKELKEKEGHEKT